MNCFSIINSFMLLGSLLCIALSMIQPTLKRKMAVLCLFMATISPLVAYACYAVRYDLPSFPLWLNAVISVFSPLASILVYQWGCRWIRKIEDMKQRSAKRASYIESLRYKEDEELF